MNIYQIIELDMKDCMPSGSSDFKFITFLFLTLFKIYYITIYWKYWNVDLS